MTSFLFTAFLAIGYVSCGTMVNPALATTNKSIIRRLADPNGFQKTGQDLLGVTPSESVDVLFGYTVALSSNGGNRLAVGAPGHDYNTPDANSTSINSGGGAIFVYDYNGTTWTRHAFLPGDLEEGLGEFISINGDGTRIAMRRSEPNRVEVYDIADDGELTRIGTALTCDGRRGDHVTLSSDGERIAMSCEYFGGNTGQVRIYDLEDDGNNWVSRVNLTGTANADFFGWKTAFSSDGNRIAISAPNHGDGNIARRGMLRVFDYNGTDWNQIGDDVLGTIANDQLGFSMDMSGDGSTVVISCPSRARNDGTLAVGVVKAFSEAGGNWFPVGNAIEGIDRNNRFGRSLSISYDGSRLAASSYVYNGFRGHVRLFDFDRQSDLWMQYGEDIEGENNGDRFAFGRSSVSLTDDGTRLASGSTLYDDISSNSSVGRVRVFDTYTTLDTNKTVPSKAPSQDSILSSVSSISSLTLETAPTAASPVPQELVTESHTDSSSPTSSESSVSPAAVSPTLSPTLTLVSMEPSTSPTQLPTTAPTTALQTTPPITTVPTSSPATKAPVSVTPTSLPTAPSILITQIPETISPTFLQRVDPVNVVETGEVTGKAESLVTSLTSPPGPGVPPPVVPSSTPALTAPSKHYTSNLGKFDWSIEREDSIEIDFDEDSLKEEITLYYSIHHRTSLVRAFEEDCRTPVPSTLVAVNTTTTQQSSDRDLLEVRLDLVQGELVGSPIFTQPDVDRGMIAICLRVDLLMDDVNRTSVVFHEQKVTINISMIGNFNVVGVDWEHIGPESVVENAHVGYNVTACQCNAQMVCETEALTQGSEAFICIRSSTPDVVITDIIGLQLSQNGGPTRQPVRNGVEDALTEVILNATGDEQLAVIRTKLVSDFFDNESSEDILAQGICSLSFSDSGGVIRHRHLRVPITSDNRVLVTEEGENVVGFDVRLNVQPAAESSAVIKMRLASIVVIMLGSSFMLI